MVNRKEFGARLRQKRLEMGLLQPELAKKSGIAKAHISAYETGKVIPYAENLLAIATALNCTTDWLFGIEQADASHSKRLWLVKMGKMLCLRRMELGLTIQQVAEQLGMPKNTYNNYELGKCRPPMDDLFEIKKPPIEPAKSYELEYVFELDNTTYNLTRSELQ